MNHVVRNVAVFHSKFEQLISDEYHKRYHWMW